MADSVLRVRVGNKGDVENWALRSGFRTQEQFDHVQRVVNSDEFDFSCMGDIFEPEDGSTYQGPFNWLWYDKKGKLHAQRIGKRGKLLADISH